MKKILFFALLFVSLLALSSCGRTRCEGGCMPGEYVRTVESTCNTKGYDLYACPECGFETDRKELPLAECEEGSWYVSVQPTCTENGTETLSCRVCGDVLDKKTIDANGHDIENVQNWRVVLSATCTREGKMEGSCPNCNQTISRATSALDHEKSTEWITTIPFTCTADGEEARKCVRCPEIMETRVVEAHHVKEPLVAVEATCTAPGKTEGLYCSGCQEIYIAQEEIPQLPHSWVIDPYVAPTCQEYGYTEGSHCDVCKKWQVEPTKISKLPHQTVTDRGYAATCTSSGKTDGTHCTLCKKSIKSQSTISALGHNFSVFTNTCSRCPEKQYIEISNRDEYTKYSGAEAFVFFLDDYVAEGDNTAYYHSVKKATNYIRFVGVPNRSFNFNIVVEKRENPLTIDFVNADMHSKNSIISSSSSAQINVGFYGDNCKLSCDKANNGSAGKKGANGNSAISVSGTLNITLQATSCRISGGEGGNGGNGKDVYGNNGQNGGNGGEGGYGISANTIYVTISTGYSKNNLYITGGDGGKGGAGGKAIPMFGIGSSLLYDNGKKGSDGSSQYATNVNISYK